jgi:hypothetical protein
MALSNASNAVMHSAALALKEKFASSTKLSQ